MTHIKTTYIKKSRKDHDCHACLFLTEDSSDIGINFSGLFSFAEWRAIAKAKADGWKIKKGQPYCKVVQTYDGVIYSFSYRPEINEIMVKHDLYPDY